MTNSSNIESKKRGRKAIITATPICKAKAALDSAAGKLWVAYKASAPKTSAVIYDEELTVDQVRSAFYRYVDAGSVRDVRAIRLENFRKKY